MTQPQVSQTGAPSYSIQYTLIASTVTVQISCCEVARVTHSPPESGILSTTVPLVANAGQ